MSDYNLGTASGRIIVDGSGAELGFKVAETAAGAFFDVVKMRVDAVQQLGKKMAAAGAAGVAGFGVAIKAASGFETQMSGVRAVTGGTEDDFESLRQKALQLGADTAYSASEAALAIEELAKAGIPIEDILKGAAEGAVALAAAGGISLPQAAEIAANAMNQFELGAASIPKVADILAGVANTSAADVSSLGTSLSQAGAVANLAGLKFEDTAIALGELADAGINGSDAGTSLKTLLNNLIPTTDKQKKAFRELGILTYDLADANRTLAKVTGQDAQKSIEGVKGALSEYVEGLGEGEIGTVKNMKAVEELLAKYGGLDNAFFNAKGNIKGLGQVQEVLRKSLAGMSDQVFDTNGKMKSYEAIQKGIKDGSIDATAAQKLQTLELLFGADAMRASAIFSKQGAKGYQEFKKQVGETTAEEVAKTRLDNLTGSVEAFKGSMETALITIGTPFLKALSSVVKAATSLVNVFNGLPPSVQKAIGVLALIASSGLLVVGMFLALLPLIISFLANMLLMKGLGVIFKSFSLFFKTLRGGAGAITAASAGAKGLSGGLTKLFTRMLLGSKIILILGKAFLFLWTAITGPIGIAIAVIAGLVLLGVLLYKKWAPFRELVDQIAAVLREKLIAAWAALKPMLLSALAGLKTFGKYVMSTLLPVLQKVGKELLGKLLTGWSDIKSAAMGLIGPIMGFVDALRGAGDAGGTLGEKILPFLQKIGNFIMTVVVPAIGWIGKMFIEKVLPILIKVVGFLGGVVISTVVSLVKGIIQAVGGIISIFTGLLNFFTGLFTGNWSKMWLGIKQIFSGAWNLIIGLLKVYLAVGVLKLVGLAFGLLKGIVKAGLGFVLTVFKTILKGVWSFVKFIFMAIVKGVKGYIGLWVKIVRGGVNLVRTIISAVMRAVLNIVKGIWNLITGIFRGGTSSITGIIGRAWNFLRSTTSRAFTGFWHIIRDMVLRVINFMIRLPSRILGALSNMGKLLYNKGKDIIQGLINGIKDMAGQVKDAAGDIAKGVASEIGDFFKIGSPSKLFHQYGKWVDQGLEGGLDEDKKRVVKSALEVAKGAMVAFQATLDPRAVRMLSESNLSAPVGARGSAPAPTAVRGESRSVTIATTVNNPKPERASQSQSKILKNKAEEAGWR